MKTIETEVVIAADGNLSIPPVENIEPGKHRVVMVIDEAVIPSTATPAGELDEFYQVDDIELEELRKAIAESEAEKAQGLRITHQEIKQMAAEIIASERSKREQASV